MKSEESVALFALAAEWGASKTMKMLGQSRSLVILGYESDDSLADLSFLEVGFGRFRERDRQNAGLRVSKSTC